MSADDLEHNTSVVDSSSKLKMKQVLLVLSLSGLALCGSLSNEYLPASTGPAGRSFGPQVGGAIGSYSPSSRFASGNFGSSSIPSSRFASGSFGSSSIPSSQYGVPGTASFKSLSGSQYSSPSQYSGPSAPAPVYGAPSSFRSSTPFSSGHTLPSNQYGAPISGVSGFGRSAPLSTGSQYLAPRTQYGAPTAGVSGFGRSTPFSSGSQYKAPSTQYGAPSAFDDSIAVDAAPSHPISQIAQSRGISTQYGAPQQYQPTQFAQPSASFRAGPQFGGASSHGVRPASGYSGTVQDANGAYFY